MSERATEMYTSLSPAGTQYRFWSSANRNVTIPIVSRNSLRSRRASAARVSVAAAPPDEARGAAGGWRVGSAYEAVRGVTVMVNATEGENDKAVREDTALAGGYLIPLLHFATSPAMLRQPPRP